MLKVISLFVTFYFFFFSFIGLGLAQSDCPTTPLEIDEFQPERLIEWIEENRSNLNSAKDFLCCVPEQVRRRYVIAHSSLAAQNGNAKNPRVIFFHKSIKDSINPNDNRLHFAFSINSGRSHLNNPNNIEFVYADQNTGELDYFDLEISRNHKGFIGGKNPEKCMACHGTNNSYGAKPLFTDRPWHNFVSGNTFNVEKNGETLQCEPIPKEVTRKIDIGALDALIEDATENDSNFSCMDVEKLANSRSSISNSAEGRDSSLLTNLIEFDDSLRYAHRHRIWKDISKDPQFNKMKYLMIGTSLCEDIRLQNWIPRQALQKAFLNIDFYNFEFQPVAPHSQIKNSLGLVIQTSHRKLLQLTREFDDRTANLQRVAEQPDNWQEFLENSDSSLHFGRNPLACYRNRVDGLIQKTFSKYNATMPILSRLELDNLLARESSNTGNHPIFRIIYEGLLSRPAIDLNMSLYAGVSSNNLDFKNLPILSQEPSESHLLESLFKEHNIRYGGLSNDFAMTISTLRNNGIPFLVEGSTWNSESNSYDQQRVFSSRLSSSRLFRSLETLSYSALSEFTFND